MKVGTIKQLWRYPVSSLGGERLDAATVGEAGIVMDRVGGLFETESGKIASPSLVKRWNVAPQMSARVSAEGKVEISFNNVDWRTHDDPSLLADLERFCGAAVTFKSYGSRLGDGFATNRYALMPLHLVSLQAIAALRGMLPTSVIDERRFRPNILADLPELDGTTPEYHLIGQEFSIGGLRLRGVRAAGRCSFTTLKQQGIPEDRDVLRVLIQNFAKNFGIYCEVLSPGEIAVGEVIRMEKSSSSVAPILIVGAGQAGAMTAKTLRELGATQPIVIHGDERFAPYERPPLSKSGNAGLVHVTTHQQLEDVDIALHLNSRVVAIHRTVREIETEDGVRHPYDKLVLATGGSAKRLPGVDRGFGRIHVIRTAEDAARLHPLLVSGKKLAVIGGGWLGLEIAATARRQGTSVTLFVRQDRVLTRSVPATVAAFITARHVAEGVDIRLGVNPTTRENGDGVEVVTANGTEHADYLAIAIGITPNDYLARLAQIETRDGILTDEAGLTSDPNVYAIGDVARRRSVGNLDGVRIESWHNANSQARALARTLLSLPSDHETVSRFWSSQYDMMIQIAGNPDPFAESHCVEESIAPFWDFGNFAIGINRARDIHLFTAKLSTVEFDNSPQQAKSECKSDFVPSRKILLGKASDLPVGVLHRIEVEAIGAILVVQQSDALYATDDKCPHANAMLSEGFIERGRIVCPVHFAEFDLETGAAYNAPPGCRRLRCYKIEQTGDDLYLLP